MRRDDGSVLVEAIVAVAIMASVLAVACRAVGDSAHRVAAVDRARLARLEARSRLDEVGADIALAPGVSAGRDAGFDWRVEITPSEGAVAANGRLMDVAVDVTQGGRPAFSLHSMRLAPSTGADGSAS